MKRVILRMTLLLSAMLLSLATQMSAQTIIETGKCGSDISWTLDDKGIMTFTGNRPNTGFFISTFRKPNKNYDTVVIGDNITKIWNDDPWMGLNPGYEGKFNTFYSAKNIIIGKDVTTIGSNAFAGCKILESITIGENVKKFESVTTGGPNFKKVNISNIKAFCEIDFSCNAYSWNNPLTGANLYVNDEEVTNLIIPEGVTKIGESAFYHCANLVSVKFPNSLTSIGRTAFYGCKNLYSITISNPNTTIEDWAFGYCSKLEKVSFPGKISNNNNQFYGTAFIKNQELAKTRKSLTSNAEVKIDNSKEALYTYALGTWTGKIGYYTITITFKANKTYTATVKYLKDYNSFAEWSGRTNHHRKMVTGTVSGKWDIRDLQVTPLDPFKYTRNASYTIDNKRMSADDISYNWWCTVNKYFSGYTYHNREDGSRYITGYDKTKKKQLLKYHYYDDLVLQRVSSSSQKSGAAKTAATKSTTKSGGTTKSAAKTPVKKSSATKRK